MEDLREKIISLLRVNGPSLPVHISKKLGSNSIFAGAMLSELLARKRLKLTNAKIGGSPLYYLEGQEKLLGDRLYNYFKEVHKKIYDLLKANQILSDKDLEPWQRVAIRELPDFAKQLNIFNGDIYWKWFDLSDNEAEIKIKEVMGINEVKESVKEPILEQEAVFEEIEEPKIEIKEEPKIAVEEPVKIKKIYEQKIAVVEEPLKQEAVNSFDVVDNYFSENSIEVLKAEMIRKNNDYEFIVNVPSNVGKVSFFVKFKSKKKLGDSDLSLAQNTAYLKRLPLLFLYNGEVNNKAVEYAGKNFITLVKI